MKVPKNALLVFVLLFFIFQSPAFGQDYYLESGGSGISIIIIRPTGDSLAAEDEFVLDYMQNLIIANFKKYTAIKASGSLSTADIDKKGTALLLIGTLSRTDKTYIIDLAVTDPVSGLRKATYRKTNIKAADILSARAINEGFLEIVQKLNVKLSEAGIAAVKNPPGEEIQAAINLARGNLAEKNNNPIEMLTYLYNAAAYDPELLEAGTRFNDFSRILSSGNIGGTVINDIKNREKWKSILDEFDNFYRAHPPFIVNFNPMPAQKGYIDYDNNRVAFQFDLTFQEDMSFDAMQKVFVSITTGLKNTKNQEMWGFITRPYRSPLFGKFRYYAIKAELVNERDEAVASTTFRVRSRIAVLRDTLYADTTGKTKQSFAPIDTVKELTDIMLVRIVSIDGIETEKAMQSGYVKIVPVEALPKTKALNLFAMLTRNYSDK